MMFKNEFQGGSHFEIFSAQGKDPLGTWRTQGGSGIRKIYEKDVKSYVYTLEGTVATTRISLPQDPKHSLTLVQRYLIFQLNVPLGAEFSLEIGITDVSNNKRRMNFSTSVKEMQITPLHAKLPLTILKKSAWVNCCLDMVNIVADTWRGQTFCSTDSMTISANCKLRRIFTMKNQPQDTTDDNVVGITSASTELDTIPRTCVLPADVPHVTQIINHFKIKQAEMRARGDRLTSLDIVDLGASGRKSNATDGFHIAFGSKIVKPPTAVTGRKSSTSGLPLPQDTPRNNSISQTRYPIDVAHSSAVLSHRSGQRLTADPLTLSQSMSSSRHRLLSDPGRRVDPSSNRNNPLNQSRSWSGVEIQEHKQKDMGFMKPHPPPRDSSADKGGRRHRKVRSGDTNNRASADAHSSQNERISGALNQVPVAGSLSPNDVLVNLSPRLQGGRLSPVEGILQRSRLDHKLVDTSPAAHTSAAPINDHYSSRNNQVSKVQGNYKDGSAEYQHLRRSRQAQNKKAEPSTQELHRDDSVSYIIEALRERVYSGKDYSEDNDEQELLDAVEQFNGHTDDVDNSTMLTVNNNEENLFQFSSPPKTALNALRNPSKNSSVLGKIDKKPYQNARQSQLAADTRLNDNYQAPVHTDNTATFMSNEQSRKILTVNGKSIASDTSHGQAMDGIRLTHPRPPDSPRLTQPRPPDSPLLRSPRPGSGRHRSQNSSQNSSNRPTPDNSGSGSELRGQMVKVSNKTSHLVMHRSRNAAEETDDKLSPAVSDNSAKPSPDSSASSTDMKKMLLTQRASMVNRKLLAKGEVLGMPSPRTSEGEPRLTSGGSHRDAGEQDNGSNHTNASSSSSASEQQAYHPSHLRRSERNSSSLSNTSQASTRVSRKSLKEIPGNDYRLVNAQHATSTPAKVLQPAGYEPKRYQVHDAFDEQHMLQFLKREQEYGESFSEEHNIKPNRQHYEHEVSISDDGGDSSDESFMTASVPMIENHDYKAEMSDTLEYSHQRDLSMFSPPIVLPSQKPNHPIESTGRSINPKAGDMRSGTDSEEELDLLFDPVLNCYFDPLTCKYYELI